MKNEFKQSLEDMQNLILDFKDKYHIEQNDFVNLALQMNKISMLAPTGTFEGGCGMTCEDCIHYDVCGFNEYKDFNEICSFFKDKSRIIELPCKVGQTVYDIVLCDDDIYRIYEMKIVAIEPFGSLYESKYFPDFIWNIYLTDDCSYAYRTFDDIGKKTFFSKEEAEKRLNELKLLEGKK